MPDLSTCCECQSTRPTSDSDFWLPRPGGGVQARCRDCNRNRLERRRITGLVVNYLTEQGITAQVVDAERRVLVDQPPTEWLDAEVREGITRAEALAERGITLADRSTFYTLLPTDPVAALRTAYRVLVPVDPATSEIAGRQGPMDDDRLYLLSVLDDLAADPAIPAKLSKHVKHVKQVAGIHAGGIDAERAAAKLLPRLRRIHSRYTNSLVSKGLLERDDAEQRLNLGLLINVKRWSPLHSSGALVTSYAGRRGERECQPRTRADRAIMVHEVEKGSGIWTKPAASLEGIAESSTSAGDDDGCFVPVMTPLIHGTVVGGVTRMGTGRAPVTKNTEADAIVFSADMTLALEGLDDVSRDVFVAFALGKKTPEIARDAGMTTVEVRAMVARVKKRLRKTLSDYKV